MRIAQLAPLQESVPPKGYGGSELVVSLLTEELTRRGHEVTLFATGDSVTEATLIACAPEGLRKTETVSASRWSAYELKSLVQLEKLRNEFDVIHNHMGYIALPHLRWLQQASLSTLHNPVSDYCAEIYLTYSQSPFVAISKSFRRLNYSKELNYVATIHNGIDLSTFDAHTGCNRDFLLFLGRISDAKGTKEAIEIARRLGLPIKIAGKIDRNDREYFESQVRPLLAEPGVEYVGEVSGAEKARLYSRAIATLCPIKFEEPFGLVFVESLASGTPVMAFRKGAAAEVVEDGVVGVIGETTDELVARYDEVLKMSASNCRMHVQQHFSKERMTDQYESLYARLVQHKKESAWTLQKT